MARSSWKGALRLYRTAGGRGCVYHREGARSTRLHSGFGARAPRQPRCRVRRIPGVRAWADRCPRRRDRRHSRGGMGGMAGRTAARSADLAARRDDRGQPARIADCRAAARARGPRPGLPPTLLAVGGMVLPRRRARGRHPLLPGASPPRAARTRPDAGGRGWHRGVVPENPPPRGGACHRQRLQAAPAAPAAAAVRPVVSAVSRLLHAETLQQELRPAPRQLVRAKPSGRGLRRDALPSG